LAPELQGLKDMKYKILNTINLLMPRLLFLPFLSVIVGSEILWADNSYEIGARPYSIYIHDFHTIDSLASLNEVQLFELIQAKAITVDCVPTGKSVGRVGRINSNVIENKNFVKVFFKGLFDILGGEDSEYVAGQIWKGKEFFRNKNNCGIGKGINLVMGSKSITFTNRIVSLKEYDADLQRFLDPSESYFVRAMEQSPNRINLVELNYSNPSLDPGHIGKKFGVRDIMVPIRGKYGVIYIGRAYTGVWTTSTQFKSSGLVAWFFLDFSSQALIDQ